MASVLLSPVGNGQQFFDNNGLPLAGGLIYQYQAGSSTPLATYTTNNGTIPNSNPIILDSAGRTPQEIWMQTGYTYKLVIQTSTGITLQTLDNLYPILQTSTAAVSPFNVGMILLWSGSIGSVPAGWALCDGSNSTPDLRNRFIVCAGSTYAVGATGGTADSIVVTHTHTATVTDPGHFHTTLSTTNAAIGSSVPTLSGSTTANTSTETTGISVANSSTGSSGTNANLPPYYALAYIMKT
jgi:microcystin-dependent protein